MRQSLFLPFPPKTRGSARITRELAELIGYAIHRPNLGNYEGQSPSVLLERDVPEFLQAQDALTAEQQTMIEQLQKGNVTMDVIRQAGTRDAQAAA
jgi:hypothetical protein